MTFVLAAASLNSQSPLNRCLTNEQSQSQRLTRHRSRRQARSRPQPLLSVPVTSLDIAPSQQVLATLLFKCTLIALAALGMQEQNMFL